MAVKKIRQYGICAANTDGELAAFVNRQIKEGWELHGFVFISTQNGQLFFHQAMVHYSDAEIVKPGKVKTARPVKNHRPN